MAKTERKKTRYPGVYFTFGVSAKSQPEKIYYIFYRRNGKQIEEKVGRQFQNDMTPAKASRIRARRIEGHELPNRERRLKEKEDRDARENRWTIEKLWESYKENKLNYKGLKKEQSRFKVHIRPVFGSKEPKEIIPLDVDRFRNNLIKKKALKPQTVKNTLELLRRISNYGMKKKLCPGLDFFIEMPECNNEINESLGDDQIGSLLKVLNENKMNIEALIMKVMLYTGRRTGEICKLEWNDIDLERQVMTLLDTKTNQNEYLPFSSQVKEIFKSVPKYHEKYVFPNKDGSLRKRTDRDAREFMLSAGIPSHFRPTYCLRHTFASIAASNDIPDRIIKTLIGHKQRIAKRDITARYAHISPARLLEAVNMIGGIIDETFNAQKK